MKISEEDLIGALKSHLSELTSRFMSKRAIATSGINLDNLDRSDSIKLVSHLSVGIKLYLKDSEKKKACVKNLLTLFGLPEDWDEGPIPAVQAPSGSVSKRGVSDVASSTPESTSTPQQRKGFPINPAASSAFDESRVLPVLCEHLSGIIARSVWKKSLAYAEVDLGKIKPGDNNRLLKELQHGIRLYIKDIGDRKACSAKLRSVLLGSHEEVHDEKPIVVQVNNEMDVVVARNLGLRFCQSIGFSKTEQIRIATAISELTRNIVQYARSGSVRMCSISDTSRGIEIVATDKGPGISNLDEILNGEYVSKRGMGKGLVGTRNLMDFFDIETNAGEGTTVTARKFLNN